MDDKTMRVIITIGIVLVCTVFLYLLWMPKSLPRTGTRSYYGRDRYLLADVHGEYLGDCFVPSMDILQRLDQEQIDSVVLIETIPD